MSEAPATCTSTGAEHVELSASDAAGARPPRRHLAICRDVVVHGGGGVGDTSVVSMPLEDGAPAPDREAERPLPTYQFPATTDKLEGAAVARFIARTSVMVDDWEGSVDSEVFDSSDVVGVGVQRAGTASGGQTMLGAPAASDGSKMRNLSTASDGKAPGVASGPTGSSRSSKNSITSNEGVIVTFQRMWIKRRDAFLTSSLFARIYSSVSSIRMQVLFFTSIHVLCLLAVIVIVQCFIGTDLPSLHFFNLMHSVLGTLGKASFVVGLQATRTITKSYTAFAMVSRPQGVALSTIAKPIPELNPDTGRTLRWLFLGSVLGVEGSLWLLGFEMDWTYKISNVGSYDCNIAQYPTAPSFIPDIGTFIQGDSEFAKVYNFGLTLADGIAGAWVAWPKDNPTNEFQMGGHGVGYAVGVLCSPPQIASVKVQNGETAFNIRNSENWGTIFITEVVVQLPAGSHAVEEWAEHDLVQTCQVTATTGAASGTFEFVADEWEDVTVGPTVELRVGNLTLTPRMERPRLFAEVLHEFGDSAKDWTNLTSWIALGVDHVFRNASYMSTQGATFCNLMQWATLPDGLYHPEFTYRGIAAAVAATAHYVLMQFNGSNIGSCDYYGDVGYGYVGAPSWIKMLAVVSVVLCLVAEVAQLFWWMLNCQSGEKYDRAARALESPLRLLYDLRLATPNVVTELVSEGVGDINLNRKFSEVFVRFGESRQTRGEENGKLILDTPKRVVPISSKRNYD